MLIDSFVNAKEYGAILKVDECNWDLLRNFIDDRDGLGQMDYMQIAAEKFAEPLQYIINVAELLTRKYDIVATNPPYMGSSGMNNVLSVFMKKYYPDSKSDMFAAFIECCERISKKNGYQAMITQHAWMFLSSYEKLRTKIMQRDIVNMAHLGSRAFEEIGGEVVQTASFVMRKSNISGYKGTYCRLIEPTTQQGKEDMFLAGENRYVAKQSNFAKIPGSPVSYWVSERLQNAFAQWPSIGAETESAAGVSSGDNDKYLKLWFEIKNTDIATGVKSQSDFERSTYKYARCNKGGSYRKWYGNNEYVALWCKSGEFHRNGATYKQLLFLPGITWSAITTGEFSARFYPDGQIFDHASPSLFANSNENLLYYLALTNSAPGASILKMINPTVNMGADSLRKLPVSKDTIAREQVRSNC